mmetsp:Transcript_10042/g.20755  ORF Transcript_10042/g.20755 Transcript_10042/m.20755 type:complete len:343 (-) Transcript_10042:59-1087(-)
MLWSMQMPSPSSLFHLRKILRPSLFQQSIRTTSRTFSTSSIMDPTKLSTHLTPPSSTSDRRTLARSTPPMVCYNVGALPPKHGGDALYAALGTAVSTGQATLQQQLEIPARSALSWKVPAGHLWRIVCTHGPQVADMNVWNDLDRQERFYTSKTRQIHATHLTTGDRLWSNLPFLRPLATITGDSIAYGFDDDGAGVHDVIGSRCDPYTHYLMTGQGEIHNHSCHSNLTRQAVQHDGLTELDVHDVLNVFMCTGFTRDTQQYFAKPSPVEVGDYIEFVAEIDVLVSASTCPQGDVSIACGNVDEEPVVHPLGVEIYRVHDALLQGWKPSEPSGYPGNHGMTK